MDCSTKHQKPCRNYIQGKNTSNIRFALLTLAFEVFLFSEGWISTNSDNICMTIVFQRISGGTDIILFFRMTIVFCLRREANQWWNSKEINLKGSKQTPIIFVAINLVICANFLLTELIYISQSRLYYLIMQPQLTNKNRSGSHYILSLVLVWFPVKIGLI